MRIAVVGAGVSGLTAAWVLNRRHDVTVFEADDRIGGHANTVTVDDGGKPLPVDTGFIVFNDLNYPILCGLFDELGVRTHESDMSFSVHCERSGREWNGSSANQYFAQRANLLRPAHWRMLGEILRFNREAAAKTKSLHDSVDVDTWLRVNGYSETFRDLYLFPLGASLWSCNAASFNRFPIRFVVEFLDNHRMLQVEGRPRWKTVSGGSSQYLQRLVAPFKHKIYTRAPVVSVRRKTHGAEVLIGTRGAEHFDEVILACHADQSLRLCEKLDPVERELLSAFPYQMNEAVLHTDVRLLPERKIAWASWNYRLPADERDTVLVTYNMNRLQGLESGETWCVTLTPGNTIQPERVHRRFWYEHPLFTAGRSAAQRQHAALIRRRGLSFCGAYWGFGFHEDGVRSAMDVCSAFDLDLRTAA